MLDKRGILGELTQRRNVEIELGCGPSKRHPEAIGVDKLDFEGVDVVGDIQEVLTCVPDSSVDLVYTSHCLEHIDNYEDVVYEVSRILKPGGALEVVVPHFSNPYFYSDPTHRRTFGLYTFSYLSEDAVLRRPVPQYVRGQGLRLVDVALNFKSSEPFWVRYGLKRLFGLLVNMSVYTKEFYEENLTGLVQCYELRFVLRKVDGAYDTTPARKKSLLDRSLRGLKRKLRG